MALNLTLLLSSSLFVQHCFTSLPYSNSYFRRKMVDPITLVALVVSVLVSLSEYGALYEL